MCSCELNHINEVTRMDHTKILQIPALTKRAKDAARAVALGVHTPIYQVTESTLTDLLGLPQFKVTGYSIEEWEDDQDVIHLYCDLTTAVAICPDCQNISSTIKQYHPRCVRDCNIWQKRTFIHFTSRRFECQACQTRFTETVHGIGWRRRQTIRFEEEIYENCKEMSIKATAERFRLSQSTVQEIFKTWGKNHQANGSLNQVRALGIDEISLKKKHKQYALVISDLDRHIVLAVLPNRDQETLTAWLNTLTPQVKKGIEVVSIDMWRPYRSVVQKQLPHVQIVADRFHVMKQLNDQLSKARRTIQRKADPEIKDRLKGCRWLIVLNRDALSPEQVCLLLQILSVDPELTQAYLLKEEFRSIFERIRDREKATRFLNAWICKVQQMGNRYLLSFVKTLHNWWCEILNYFCERISNGFVEGINRAIRSLIWRAYGFRNFENFRLLILAKFAFP